MATATLPDDTENDFYDDQNDFDQAFDEIVEGNPDLAEVGSDAGNEELPNTYRQNTGGTNVSPVRSYRNNPVGSRSEKLDFGSRSSSIGGGKGKSSEDTPSGREPAHIWGNPAAEKKLQKKKAQDAGYKNPQKQQKAQNKSNLQKGTDELSRAQGGATSEDGFTKATGKLITQVVEGNWEGAGLSLGASSSLKRGVLIGGGLIIAIFAMIGFFIAQIVANPFEFLKTVVTDKAVRRFAITAADAVGVPGASQVKSTLEAAGLVYEVKSSNVAVAAPDPANKPEAGSIDDILAHIDWEKAQWKYGNTYSCAYRFTFKPYVNYDNQTIHLIDKVYAKGTGKEVPVDQATDAINTCFMNSYPMFNLSVRAKPARVVNKGSSAYLGYASDKDQVNQLDQSQADAAFQKKTLERITDKKDQGPTTTEQKVKQFADKIYDEIEQGKDPNTLDWDGIAQSVGLTFPTNDQDATQVAQSMCTYYTIFTNPDNTVRAIQTRHNVSVRNGLKFLSLAGSNALYRTSNKETNYTANSIANWANAAGYSLQTGDGNKGDQASAESLLNRAYIITPIEALRLNKTLSLACSLSANADRGAGGGIFGGLLQGIFQALGKVGQSVVLAVYQQFRAKVVADSSGIFEIGNPNNFGMKEILIASFKVSATGGSTGTEAGPQNFNRQVMGVDQVTSDYMRAVGGRFLTEAERSALAIRVENDARAEEKNKSLIARIFDTNSPRSIVSQIASRNTSPQDTKTYLASSLKSFSNPLQYFADSSRQFAFVTTGQNNRAFAAGDDTSEYFKLELSGFSPQELSSVNLLDNAKAIEKLKKELDFASPDEIRNKQIQYYDECIKKQGLTSKVLFTRIPIDSNVDNTKPEDQLKYIYIKKGFELGGNGEDVIFTGKDPTNPADVDVDSEFYKIYTCETMLTNTNPIKMAKIDLDFAKRYRLYLYYKSQMELLRDLSQDKPPSYFYAGTSGSDDDSSGGGGSFSGLPADKSVMTISQCWGGIGGHPGIDLAYLANKTPSIFAVDDGVVEEARTEAQSGGYGNMVYLKHSNGLYTLYAHNKELKVQKGDQVQKGQEIAIGDTTGYSTGPHLHFEVRSGPYSDARSIHNPVFYIPQLNDLPGLNCKTGKDEAGQQ